MAQLKKTLALLDERVKQMSKAAALSGNTAMAGAGAGGAGLFDDMEAAIKQIRDDLDAHKN